MAGATIRVLGCGDAFGSGGRFQSCYMVRALDQRCLIDCGASALIAMRRFGIDPASIDAVFVSHLHGDHFGGLPFLLLDGQFSHPRRRPLVIAGPSGTRDRLMAALEVLFPGSSSLDWRFALSFTELAPGRTETIGAFELTPYPAVHPSGSASFAFRLGAGDRIIAYSGDTEWTDALIEAASGADLFISECYGFNGTPRFHMDYSTLRYHLDDLDARRVVLTHMSDAMLAHVDALALETTEDGQLIEL